MKSIFSMVARRWNGSCLNPDLCNSETPRWAMPSTLTPSITSLELAVTLGPTPITPGLKWLSWKAQPSARSISLNRAGSISLIHLPDARCVASVSDLTSLSHEAQKAAYDAQPKAGSIATCAMKRAMAMVSVGMSSGKMSYPWDWDGWRDNEPTDISGSSTSDHATANRADEKAESLGVLSGKRRGSGVAARKKADHAKGRSRVAPGGFRRCLSHPAHAPGGGDRSQSGTLAVLLARRPTRPRHPCRGRWSLMF